MSAQPTIRRAVLDWFPWLLLVLRVAMGLFFLMEAEHQIASGYVGGDDLAMKLQKACRSLFVAVAAPGPAWRDGPLLPDGGGASDRQRPCRRRRPGDEAPEGGRRLRCPWIPISARTRLHRD